MRINPMPLLASAFTLCAAFIDPELAYKLHLTHIHKEVTEHGFHEMHERKRSSRKIKRLAYT